MSLWRPFDTKISTSSRTGRIPVSPEDIRIATQKRALGVRLTRAKYAQQRCKADRKKNVRKRVPRSPPRHRAAPSGTCADPAPTSPHMRSKAAPKVAAAAVGRSERIGSLRLLPIASSPIAQVAVVGEKEAALDLDQPAHGRRFEERVKGGWSEVGRWALVRCRGLQVGVLMLAACSRVAGK